MELMLFYTGVLCTIAVTTTDAKHPAPPTEIILDISKPSLEEYSRITLICSIVTAHTPSLSLFQTRVGQATPTLLKTVDDITLTYSMTVYSDDNQAEFYCKAVNSGTGPVFDLESDRATINVWFRPDGLLIDKTEPSIEGPGQMTSIVCETLGTANPEPVQSLYFDDELVYNTTGMTLTYNVSTQREHYGVQLTCTATSSQPEHLQYERSSGDRFYNVFFPTRSNTMNDEASDPVSPGQVKTITCQTGSANPVVDMIWTRNNSIRSIDVTSQTETGGFGGEELTSSYGFTATITDDGVVVSCTPVWEGAELTPYREEVTITVLYAPSEVSLTLETKMEGENSTIQCSSDPANPAPELSLYKNDVQLGSTVFELYIEYTLTVTRQMNKENVFCRSASSDRNLLDYIVLSSTEELNITFPPDDNNMKLEASDPTEAGREKVLTCSTGSANPVSSITWRRGGVDITSGVTSTPKSGDYHGKELISSYTFIADAMDDGVSVSCTPVWEGSEMIQHRREVTLDITYRPSAVDLIIDTDVEEYENQTIQCSSSTANPEPILTLYKSGNILKVSLPGENLTHLLEIERNMNGNTFLCRSTSSNEDKLDYMLISTTEVLAVKFPPDENSIDTEAPDPVREGFQKIVTCDTGSANPVSGITWRKSGTVVTSGVGSQSLPGLHGGEALQSSYAFSAVRSDDGVLVSCTPTWRGSELTNYKREGIIHVVYVPATVTLKVNTDTEESETITIECRSTAANPDPVLTLHKDDMRLGNSITGLTLVFDLSITREMNEQGILCVAASSDADLLDYIETSSTEKLNVTFPPLLNTINSDASDPAEAGSTKLITCDLGSARPVSEIIWRKGGIERMASSTEVTGNYGGQELHSSYSFTVDQSDQGVKMTCAPVWQGVEFSHLTNEVTIDVVYRPPSVTLSLESDVREAEMRQIVCTCSTANPEPQLTLYIDGLVLQSIIGVDLTYDFTVSREMNGQSVRCIAISSDMAKLDYTVYAIIETLNVSFPPLSNTLTPGASDPVEVGEVIVFTCTIGSANPVSSMIWRRDNTEMPAGAITSVEMNGDHQGVQLESSYTSTAQLSHHGGVVSCTPVWQGVELTEYRIDTVIDVVFTPLAVMLILETDVMEGENRVIRCTADAANPRPILTLYKQGQRLGDSVIGQQISHTLHVTRQMNGQSISCSAISSDPSKLDYTRTSSNKVLNITFQPNSNIMNPAAAVAVRAGNTKTLTCRIGSSRPVSGVTWRNETEEILSGSVTVDLESGQYGGESIVTTYTFTAEEADHGRVISCTPVWLDGSELTEYKREVTLDVTYPPVISVEGPPSDVEEAMGITIRCAVQDGNPADLSSLYWEFEPKYPGSQSQVLPDQRENRELVIESALYTDAGIYTCSAGNTVGSDEDQTQITVHYPPQLFDKDDAPLIFYSELQKSTTLTFSIRALPEFADIDSAITWMAPNGDLINTSFTESSKVQDEVFVTQMVIESVEESDLGDYIVTAANIVQGLVDFTLQLYQTGPPEAVHNMAVPARSSNKATVSWVVGLNGGSPQTFELIFTAKTESGHQLTFPTGDHDPKIGSVLSLTAEDLSPMTEYQAQIISFNENHGDNSAESRLLTIQTREVPLVNEDELQYQVNGSWIVLTWTYKVKDYSYTTAWIHQCRNQSLCLVYDVTNHSDNTLRVQESEGVHFFLVIYQDGLEAYRSQAFVQIKEDGPTGDTQRGLIIGLSVGFVVLLLACVLIIAYKFTRPKTRKVFADTQKLEEPTKCTPEAPQKLQETRNGMPPTQAQIDFDTLSVQPELAHQYNRLAPIRLKSATQRRKTPVVLPTSLWQGMESGNLALNPGARQYNRLEPLPLTTTAKESKA